MKKIILTLFMLYSAHKELLGYGEDINGACENQLINKGSYLIMEANDKDRYKIHCELVEPELVPMFGKWRFIMDEKV